MGTWTLPALQGWTDPIAVGGQETDDSPWTHHQVAVLGDQEALDTCLCPPSPNPALFLSEAEFGLLKFCTLIKL